MTLCDGGGSAERYALRLKKYFICIISYYNLYYCVCFINRFSICRPTDERYVTGGGGRPSVTLCDGGGGRPSVTRNA